MQTHTATRRARKLVDRWKQARPLMEQWRRDLTEVDIELKQPKLIDPLLANTASGEQIDGEGMAKQFRAEVIYVTDADVTVRRSVGAILVLEKDEIVAMTDGQNHLEL